MNWDQEMIFPSRALSSEAATKLDVIMWHFTAEILLGRTNSSPVESKRISKQLLIDSGFLVLGAASHKRVWGKPNFAGLCCTGV
jgi:hypothetical protein